MLVVQLHRRVPPIKEDMKVKELIDILSHVDYDIDVIVAKDPEGNGFNFLVDVAVESAYQKDGWMIETIRPKKMTPELEQAGYTEEDIANRNDTPCIVLWP